MSTITATAAPRSVVGTLSPVVELKVSSVVEEPGFNDRLPNEAGLVDINDLLPLIVAKGGVMVPITVFRRKTQNVIISGHRRIRCLQAVADIKSGLPFEDAIKRYDLTKANYELCRAADVNFASVRAIVEPEESVHLRRVENFLSNTGKPYSRKEQGQAFLRMRGMTYKDWTQITQKPLPDGLKLDGKIQDRHIAEMCGVSPAYVSTCISYVEQENDPRGAVKRLVHTAEEKKEINSNEGSVIIARAESPDDAKRMIASYARVRAEKEAARKAKLHATKKEEAEEAEKAEALAAAASIAPSALLHKLPSELSRQERETQWKYDVSHLRGICDRQGLTFVADIVEQWARERELTLPWTRKPVQSVSDTPKPKRHAA